MPTLTERLQKAKAEGIIGQRSPNSGCACPACGSGIGLVTDSRPISQGIRRRRACADCHHRWTTLEIVVENNTLRQTLPRIRAMLDVAFAELDKALAACDALQQVIDLGAPR